MKLSEAAARVIELSRKVRDYYDAELPKYHPNYPVVSLDEEDPPPPPERAELRQFLMSIPPEVLHQLILLMYLGRGDYDIDQLEGQYESLRETFRKRDWAVSQVMEIVPLGDYLSDALAAISERNRDVDALIPRRPRARKG